MVKLRVFERNLPDQCRNNLLTCRSETIPEIIEGLNDPSEASLVVWLPAIHRFLDIYKLPNSELKKLLSILYRRIFILDTSLDGLCVTLRLLNRCLSLKSKISLTVNWRDFYDFYQELLKISKSVLISRKQFTAVFEEISKCMKRSRRFFSDTSAREILNFFKPQLCPGGKNTEQIMWICNLMPNKGQGSPDWIPEILDLLLVDHRNLNCVINIMNCLASAAKSYPSFDWNSVLPRLYNEILPSLPLLTKNLPRPKTFFYEPPRTVNLNAQYMKKSSAFAQVIAFTLDLTNVGLLAQWLRNMQGTIKEGKMLGSGYINYISRIVNSYCKRIRLANEGKLTRVDDRLTQELVDLFLPLVRLVFYSNQLSQIDRLCSQLCFLRPSALEVIVGYCLELLQDSEVPHLSAVQVLTGILRQLTEAEGRSEVVPCILNLTLAELSPVDIQKSCKILLLYTQFACYQLIKNEIWACDLFKNLLNTLSELESSNEGANESRGLKIEEYLELSLNILTDNITEPIYQSWVEDFFEYVKRNNNLNAVNEFGIIGKYLVRRDPARVLPGLVKLCENLSTGSKNQTMWRIGILKDALIYSRTLEYAEKVKEIVREIMKDYPELSGNLLAGLMNGGIDVYPVEYSCVLPTNKNRENVDGRIVNQTDQSEIDLEITWHVPSETDINTVNEILREFVLEVPRTKQDLKNYLKLILPVVQTWCYFIKIKNAVPGFVKFPNFSIYERLVDFEDSFKVVFEIIENLDFFRDDPLLLESFIEVLSNVIHNNSMTFAFVRMGCKLVNELRRNNFNPLIPISLKNLNETRPYLIKKTANLYKKIVSSNYCQKTFTGDYSLFFGILLKYSQCQYKSARAKAISSIKYMFKSSFISLKSIIRETWQKINKGLDLENAERFKIQVEILVDQEAVWRKNIIREDLHIFEILVKTQKFSDVEIQTQFFNYFCNYVMSFYPNCRLVNKKFCVTENPEVTEKIMSIVKSNVLTHWRSQIYLLILLLSYKISFQKTALSELYDYLLPLLVNENFDLRETAQRVLGTYLWLHAKTTLIKENFLFNPGQYDPDLRYFTPQGSVPIPIHLGYTDLAAEYVYKARPDLEISDQITDFFQNDQKIEKFFEFLAVGHMLKSEESIVKNPRPQVNESSNSSIRFLNNPQKFLEAFYTRPGTLPDFSEKTANLVQYYGEVYGESASLKLFEAAEKSLLKEKPYQISALEVLTGLGSASRTWPTSDRFVESLRFGFKNSSINSVSSWSNMLVSSLKKLSLNVQEEVFFSLVELMSVSSNKKLSKVLKLLASVTQVLSWRGSKLYLKFYEMLKVIPNDIFADLRTSVSVVLSKMIVNTSYISKIEVKPCLEVFDMTYLHYREDVIWYLKFLSSTDSGYSDFLLLEIISQLYGEVPLDYMILPLLVNSLYSLQTLLRHPDIKIVTKASDVLKLVSPLRCNTQAYDLILQQVKPETNSKVQEMIKGLILTMTWYYNQFLLSPPIAYLNELIQKGGVELKQTARFYLSIIWKVADDARKTRELEESQSDQEVNTCYRLSALILGQNEFIEKWKGQALVKLARMKKHGGEVTLCVNSTIAEFWKNHKAWWKSFMNYSKCFTEEELEEIESVDPDLIYFS